MTKHQQGHPVRMENVLMPTPIALAVAHIFGRKLPVLTTRSVWRLGERLARTHGGFYV